MKLLLYIFIVVNSWSLKGNNRFYARDIDVTEWESFLIKPSNKSMVCYYLNLFCDITKNLTKY
jgi:hypothetical protein